MRGGVEYKFGSGPKALQLRFMHCSPRDHSVAWGVPGSDKRLNHIMLEVDNLDDVGLTHDVVRKAKIPVPIPLGKHSNDQMFSFYFQSPSGFNSSTAAAAAPRRTSPNTSTRTSTATRACCERVAQHPAGVHWGQTPMTPAPIFRRLP